MADQKISELTALTGANVADDDAIAIVDTSATETKKIVFSELKNALMTGALTTTGLTVEGTNNAGNTGTPTIVIKDLDTAVVAGQYTGSIEFETSDTGNSGINSYIRSVMTGSGGAGSFTFGTGFAGSLADRVLIDDNGDISFYEDTGTTAKFHWSAADERLGIGTASPATALEVLSGSASVGALKATNASGASASTPILEAVNGGGNTRLIVLNNGNVGIGTSTPHDLGSSFAVLNLDGSNGGAIAFSEDDNTTDQWLIYTNSDDSLRFAYGSNYASEAMRIDSSGNLLVNTTGGTLPESGTTSAHAGVSLDASNYVAAARYQNTAGFFNRIGNDGDIVQFRKDGSTVGGIGVSGGNNTYFSATAANHGGIMFSDAGASQPTINPLSSGSTLADASVNIGGASYRFKDLYLSGGVVGNSNSITISTDNGTTDHVTVDTSGNLLVGKTAASGSTQGVELRTDGRLLAVSTSDFAGYFNRKSTDGEIVRFVKDTTTVGSIGVASSNNLYIGATAANHAGVYFGTNIVYPMTAGSISDGSVDLGEPTAGRFKDLYLSGGVVFGATGGNVTSKTLDDYEEGTWTVNMYDATSGGNVSSTQVTGSYTKIGQQVTASFDAFNNVSTSGLTAGNAVYFTLPFAATSTGRSIGSVQLDSVSFPNSGTMVTTSVADSQSRATLNTSGNGLTDFTVKVQDFNGTSSDVVTWTLSYRTSS